MTPGRRAAALALALAFAGPAGAPGLARAPRPYSLSFEVRYGREPARASYRERIERALGAWLASTGPLGASIEPGETDLHLELILHRITVSRHYPEVSAERNVLFDPEAGPTRTFSTLFEVEARVVDARREGYPVLEKELSVFNEQGYTKFITDPKARSWEVNVEFLLDRLGALLHKKRKRIHAYLRERGSWIEPPVPLIPP